MSAEPLADLLHALSADVQAVPGEVGTEVLGALMSRERERLEALYRYGILDTPPEPPFERIVRLASTYFGTPMALTTFVDAERQWFKARVGVEEEQTDLESSFCRVAIESGERRLVILDATKDERVAHMSSVTAPQGVRFYAGSVLITPEGDRLGTLCVFDRVPRTFSAEQEQALDDFAALVMDELALRRSLEQVSQLALRDSLTGLPNRMHLKDHLHQSMARARLRGEKVVVALLDLDGFKLVNDSLGHAAGDELLKLVALRLKDQLASSDLVARMGGDEFVVVLDAMRSVADISKVIERVQRAFAEPFVLAGQQVYVRWSIGSAVFPDDASESEDLLLLADAAMYRSKRSGAHSAWAPSGFLASAPDRHRLAGLHQAEQLGELRMYVQPVVMADSRRVVAHEALIRWQRPEGLVMPGQFIPFAEKSGLIVGLGRWMLRSALHEISSGRLSRVSVNVSASELSQPDFASVLKFELDRSGIDPSRLVLELTESALLDYERGREVVLELRALGVRLALDDFGTGYSSMNAVFRLPLNFLKIDRSFVADVGEGGEAGHRALEVVRAVVTLSSAHGMISVAEGVETALQAQLLTEVGCQMLQGYLFGRPAPVTSVLLLPPPDPA